MLEFYDILFHDLGKRAATRQLTWATLQIKFKDTDTGHHPSATLDLLLPISPSTTIAELAKAGRDYAKGVLEASLRALEQNDIGALQRAVDSREELEQKAIDDLALAPVEWKPGS